MESNKELNFLDEKRFGDVSENDLRVKKRKIIILTTVVLLVIAAVVSCVVVQGITYNKNLAIYSDAERDLENGDYDKAYIKYSTLPSDFTYNNASVFEKMSLLTKYKEDMILAEEKFATGVLDEAYSLYTSLPDSYKLNGVSVKERLNILEKNQKYVRMCGKWCAPLSAATIENLIGEMENMAFCPDEYFLDIRCIINEDQSITAKGSFEFGMLTSFYGQDVEKIKIDFEKVMENGNFSIEDNYLTVDFSNMEYSINFILDDDGGLDECEISVIKTKKLIYNYYKYKTEFSYYKM